MPLHGHKVEDTDNKFSLMQGIYFWFFNAVCNITANSTETNFFKEMSISNHIHTCISKVGVWKIVWLLFLS
jgi:hypothetical protein